MVKQKEKLLKKIDQALNSKKNKLSRKTRKNLEDVRAGLEKSNTLKDIAGWVFRLLKIIGVKSILKDAHWPGD
jgi:hypothetical protein